MTDDDLRGDAAAEDAIALLTNDHQEVADLFANYDALVEADADDDERREAAEEICTMLTVHATIEEEIFYPAARDALDDERLVEEALVEHESARALIEKIQSGDPSDPSYDASVKVLGEYVAHHVREEEDNLFPAVEDAGLDLVDLGEQLAARQEELLSAGADL